MECRGRTEGDVDVGATSGPPSINMNRNQTWPKHSQKRQKDRPKERKRIEEEKRKNKEIEQETKQKLG